MKRFLRAIRRLIANVLTGALLALLTLIGGTAAVVVTTAIAATLILLLIVATVCATIAAPFAPLLENRG